MKILLFDVDGVLTEARSTITQEMGEVLQKAKKKYKIGFVGGSNFIKQQEQLGEFIDIFDFQFPENGTVFLQNSKIVKKMNFVQQLGQQTYNDLVNYCLLEMSKIDLPFKTGTFVEYRNGLVNISPVGRACNMEQRKLFDKYNKKHQILEKLASKIREKFKNSDIVVSIGGKISMDIFPVGWDKTYCLQYLKEFKEIHFFGDKVHEGGNDYQIYNDKRTVGHYIENGPKQTISEIQKLL